MADTSLRRGPVVARQTVKSGLPYAEYRQPLREDFCWACAYCSLTELESKGQGFHIDHYDPKAAGGSDDYANLCYSCQACNNKKKDWKSPRSLVCKGYYPLRIDLEDPRPHIESSSSEDGLAQHLTETGRFNIELFDLNRWALREVRRLRSRLAYSREHVAHGLRVLKKNLRIDSLPPDIRPKVVQIRAALEREGLSASEAIDEVLRHLCGSDLLDPDEDQAKRTQERRAYLKSLQALLPPKRT